VEINFSFALRNIYIGYIQSYRIPAMKPEYH
jgi:hypothetical protein